ncbi:uncharacterized protein LOC144128777 [Amblyomma americanum]
MYDFAVTTSDTRFRSTFQAYCCSQAHSTTVQIKPSLRLPILVRTPTGRQTIAQAEKRLLQARILETKCTIKRLENDIYCAQQFLEKLIPADFFDVLLHANSEGAKNQELKHLVQNAKFKQLLASPPEGGVTASICKLSSHTLDPHERSLLLRGLNFNTGAPPNAVNMTCAVEEAIRKVAPSLQSEARSRAIGALSKLAKSKTRTITPAEQTALTRLQKNKDIVILPADKGNATVVLDRTDYVRKMDALLEDTTTYAKLSRGPTKKIES